MSQPNQHNYPPLDPLQIATPEQLEALVNGILQSKMTDMSQAFAQEWDKREQNFVAENAELRAQLEAANDQIARMQIAYVDGILQVLGILLTIKQCRQHSNSSTNSCKIDINLISQHYCAIQECAK